MPTYRALFESDDSASIVKVDRIACRTAATVIAGNRNRFFFRNAKLPANSTCSRSSSRPGTSVTKRRNANRTAALPKMYSVRISGFDR